MSSICSASILSGVEILAGKGRRRSGAQCLSQQRLVRARFGQCTRLLHQSLGIGKTALLNGDVGQQAITGDLTRFVTQRPIHGHGDFQIGLGLGVMRERYLICCLKPQRFCLPLIVQVQLLQLLDQLRLRLARAQHMLQLDLATQHFA